MVRQYARRRERDVGRLKTIVDRIHAEGEEEFDLYDVAREQEELRVEKTGPRHTYTGRHHFTYREIAALLHTKQRELGIEPAGTKQISIRTGAYPGTATIRVWRFKHPRGGEPMTGPGDAVIRSMTTD